MELDSKYSYHINCGILRIVDLFSDNIPSKTVTNNIHNVLAEIKYDIGSLPRDIIYRDTMNNWDRVIIDDNDNFVMFFPCSDRKNGII